MPHSVLVRDAAPSSRGGVLNPLLATLWVGAVSIAWWAVLQRQLEDAGMRDALAAGGLESAGSATAIIAIGSTLSRLGAAGLETLFFWSWWRMWGDRIRFGRVFVAIVTLSLIDAWAITLQALARAHVPGIAAWLAPILGLSLAHAPVTGTSAAPGGAWAVAFGTLGLATLVRIALTARMLATETGRRLAQPLALTAGAWLVTRLALGLGLDLVRGASPLP
jgi:hypothetical protein